MQCNAHRLNNVGVGRCDLAFGGLAFGGLAFGGLAFGPFFLLGFLRLFRLRFLAFTPLRLQNVAANCDERGQQKNMKRSRSACPP